MLGAIYKINALTLKGILLNQKINGAGPTQGNFQTVGLGGGYRLTEKLGADLGYYTTKDPNSQNLTDTTQPAAGLAYDLMPGVKAYGQYAATQTQENFHA